MQLRARSCSPSEFAVAPDLSAQHGYGTRSRAPKRAADDAESSTEAAEPAAKKARVIQPTIFFSMPATPLSGLRNITKLPGQEPVRYSTTPERPMTAEEKADASAFVREILLSKVDC